MHTADTSPSAGELLDLLERATRQPPDSHDSLLEQLVLGLHACNAFQWRKETEVRDAALADGDVAEIKREIDASNRRRADLVEAIDDLFVGAFAEAERPPTPDRYVNSESPGQLVDRLSILTLKRFHTRAHGSRDETGAAERAVCEARASQLEAQVAYVGECYDRLLRHLGDGSASMLVCRQFKLYEDGDLLRR
jgi:hypothetical protein